MRAAVWAANAEESAALSAAFAAAALAWQTRTREQARGTCSGRTPVRQLPPWEQVQREQEQELQAQLISVADWQATFAIRTSEEEQ